MAATGGRAAKGALSCPCPIGYERTWNRTYPVEHFAMTSLVTIFGGSGFVGRHTVRAFAKAGWRIRVAVRHPNLANYLLPMGNVGQIAIVKTDATDAEQVARAVASSDAVVNLVGILWQSGHQSFEAVHAEAAENIAKAAKAAGAKTLVHVSAIGADEESEAKYSKSKADGEARIRAAFPDAAILRPSVVFGPEDSFLNKFASLAAMLPFLPLIGGGHTRFQPAFVGDVAAAILKCAGDETTRGKTYELGGPETISFKALMQFLLKQTCRKKLLIPVPFGLASLKAVFLGLLPNPILTLDQVKMLKTDNVVHDGMPGFADLGITPDSLEAIAPSYLWRFRPKGQFEAVADEAAKA